MDACKLQLSHEKTKWEEWMAANQSQSVQALHAKDVRVSECGVGKLTQWIRSVLDGHGPIAKGNGAVTRRSQGPAEGTVCFPPHPSR